MKRNAIEREVVMATRGEKEEKIKVDKKLFPLTILLDYL